jgi:hypothetical protein
MIKIKSDSQKMINNLKESNNILQYETDKDKITIQYKADKNLFNVVTSSKLFKINSNGEYKESVILEMIFIDRKYINRL